MDNLPDIPRLDRPEIKDALAILAHTYLRFGRPRQAAMLLGAVAQLERDPTATLRTRCLALLQAGLPDMARTEALRLLDAGPDDVIRVQLLRILAKASWRLDDTQAARDYQAAARTVNIVERIRKPRQGSLE